MSVLRSSLLASAIAVSVAACTTVPPDQPPKPQVSIPPAKPEAPKELLRATTFGAIPGWEKDSLREAWPAFIASCDTLMKKADWKEPCTIARGVEPGSDKAIRGFFEAFFVPHQVFNQDGSDTGLVTGYYEPLLRGARKRGGPFQTPLHRAPDDLVTVDLGTVYPELKSLRLRGKLVGNRIVPYPTRAEMSHSNALAGKELVWVDDPVEAFFLQVQGSGRVQLTDTRETIRVAYADQNGHPYKSIGRYLVDKGEMTLDQASAQSIKAWYQANPARQQELLNANPSYVFFKEEKLTDPGKGPKGALGVPLTPQRSIAVDPQFIPLGTPVFLATTQPGRDTPLQRLVMAQDTGGAIRNPVRADFFWGFGADAGDKAGKMKQRGQMWVLLPRPGAASTAAR
ncbi:MAG TPA: murein transglycosylase A [Noviherbaspirillum sp.]|uniref:murein transglycosylase A n=1 Tax=Noviherbaspirillum sp. TaxID=1926288 RepID=UPI002D67EFFD|nr:murein transglycosylase A [Noviherbaspirillum sp.]HYD94195.1 murein transglycosylase A [Noviherbaspirillum sp.]